MKNQRKTTTISELLLFCRKISYNGIGDVYEKKDSCPRWRNRNVIST